MTPEQAQFAAHLFTQGLESEFAATKKVLAAIPEAKKSYRPDEHARTASELAAHLVCSDVSFLHGIVKGEFAPEADKKFASITETVQYYDKEFPAALAKVKALPAERLAQTIPFFGVFNLPAAAYLAFANNHSIHHRAQLATYLRPMGSKVPSIYGGSYDEPMEIPAAAH